MKKQALKPVLFALLVVLGATACEKDPATEPNPSPNPPQQELPNPLPAKALVSKLKWTDNDYYDFTYNAQNQVSHLHFQWQYVEGDPTQIRSIDYDFQYDAQDKPVQVNYTGGFSTKYAYHGNLVHRTKEFYPGGDWSREVTYIYVNDRITQEIWHVNGLPGEPVDIYKYEFGYDAKGNLAEVKTYEQVTDSTSGQQQFKLLETLEYSDFDDKINPTSWMLRYPYLPQVRWQMNNPRRETRRLADGVAKVTTHEYEYNGEGLPISRRTTSTGGTQATAYIY
jgi:YD repeat-containing protein